MQIELQPCPFCGKDAQIAPEEIGSGGQHVPPYHAGCFRGAGCGVAFTADDPDEAIAEWNRRSYLSAITPAEAGGLVERLRGIYRIPITDGLGAVGSGEEPDNPNEFVRKFDTPPIQHEAADAIEALSALEPAARDTKPVVSHETANVRDKLPFERNATNDQIAAVMLQHGTESQRREALAYAGVGQLASPENAGEMLARLKDDAALWAAEFRQTAIRLGYSDMDEAWLIGWFANAIENTETVRRKKWAQNIIKELTAAGIRLAGPDDRIIGKDEVDQVTLEKAAALIEESCLLSTSDGQQLAPRRDGDIHGLAYAAAIRAIGRKA